MRKYYRCREFIYYVKVSYLYIAQERLNLSTAAVMVSYTCHTSLSMHTIATFKPSLFHLLGLFNAAEVHHTTLAKCSPQRECQCYCSGMYGWMLFCISWFAYLPIQPLCKLILMHNIKLQYIACAC